jgi:hypothetical protein
LRNNRSNFGEFVARETIAEKDHYVKLWENMTPLQMIAEGARDAAAPRLASRKNARNVRAD